LLDESGFNGSGHAVTCLSLGVVGNIAAPVDALGRCQAKARRACKKRFCGGNGVGRVRVQGLRAPAPFGRGE
jgi:hypothetical protein